MSVGRPGVDYRFSLSAYDLSRDPKIFDLNAPAAHTELVYNGVFLEY